MGVGKPQEVREKPRLQAIDLVLVDGSCRGEKREQGRLPTGPAPGSFLGPSAPSPRASQWLLPFRHSGPTGRQHTSH